MCTLWHALLQIIVEVFPVSSSGHLSLVEQWGKLSTIPPYIYYMLHIPMLFIIGIYGWLYIRASKAPYREWLFYGLLMVWYGFCALAITTVIYILFHHRIDSLHMPLFIGFAITASMLFALRVIPTNNDKPFCWWRAAFIGLVQGLAFLPGVSRLASTYVAGRACGLSAQKSFWFSWWIDIPILLFGILSGCRTIIVSPDSARFAHAFFVQPCMLIGIVVCTVLAYIGFGFVAYAAKKEWLWYGAWYMLIPIICSLFVG